MKAAETRPPSVGREIVRLRRFAGDLRLPRFDRELLAALLKELEWWVPKPHEGLAWTLRRVTEAAAEQAAAQFAPASLAALVFVARQSLAHARSLN